MQYNIIYSLYKYEWLLYSHVVPWEPPAIVSFQTNCLHSQTNPGISLHMLYAKWEILPLLIFLLSNLLPYFLKTCFSKKTLSLGSYVLLYCVCVCVCVCACVWTHTIIILHCTSLETKADALSNLRLSVVAGLQKENRGCEEGVPEATSSIQSQPGVQGNMQPCGLGTGYGHLVSDHDGHLKAQKITSAFLHNLLCWKNKS